MLCKQCNKAIGDEGYALDDAGNHYHLYCCSPESPKSFMSEPVPTAIPLFSYDEVRKAICEGCKMDLPDVHQELSITHYCNGIAIPCTATMWRRNKAVLEKAHPATD